MSNIVDEAKMHAIAEQGKIPWGNLPARLPPEARRKKHCGGGRKGRGNRSKSVYHVPFRINEFQRNLPPLRWQIQI